MTKIALSPFEPFAFANGVSLSNRIVMAPMTTWAGNNDGTVSDEEIAYYRRRAAGGAGLIITGCTHVTQDGIGFTDEYAAYDDSFIDSLRRLAEAVKSGGAPAVLQIFHAGHKAVRDLVPGGQIVSASAVPAHAGSFNTPEIPRALDQEGIESIIAAFGDATRRAIEAGFDGVELHGAHSFLIQNFLSPRYNQRSDQWGGSLENRMRFPLAVAAEVKAVVDQHAKAPFLLGYRISAEESEADGLRIEDSLVLIDRLIDQGIDYLHVSLGSLLEQEPIGHHDGKTIAQLVSERAGSRVPVMAAGNIRTPAQSRRAMETGLSLVAVGQGLVMNPDWVCLAAEGRDDQIEVVLHPSAVSRLSIPPKLWTVIEATEGWFTLGAEAVVAEETPRHGQDELTPAA